MPTANGPTGKGQRRRYVPKRASTLTQAPGREAKKPKTHPTKDKRVNNDKRTTQPMVGEPYAFKCDLGSKPNLMLDTRHATDTSQEENQWLHTNSTAVTDTLNALLGYSVIS